MARSSGLDLHPPEDPYEFPSDDSIKEMTKPDQIATMVEWFRYNFEDPANETPYESAEGGYIYIWGGPYDASEELGDRFGGVVAQSVIEKAVDEVQKDCWDWAPASRRIKPTPDQEEAPPLQSEEEARARMLQRLSEIEEALKELRAASGGIGHNNPPEPIGDVLSPLLEVEINKNIIILRQESEKSEPDVETIARGANLFRSAAQNVTGWIARKCDIAMDEAAKTIGKAIGLLIVAGVPVAVASAIYGLPAKLIAASEAVLNWLQYVATPF